MHRAIIFQPNAHPRNVDFSTWQKNSSRCHVEQLFVQIIGISKLNGAHYSAGIIVNDSQR